MKRRMIIRASAFAATAALLLGTPRDVRGQPDGAAEPPEPATPAEPQPAAAEDAPPAPKPEPKASITSDGAGSGDGDGNARDSGDDGDDGDGDDDGDGEDDKSSVDIVNEKATAARSAADELDELIGTVRSGKALLRADLSGHAETAASKAHAAASAANEAEIEAGLLPTSFDLLVESARAGVMTLRMTSDDDAALEGAARTAKFTRAIADGAERAAKNVEKKEEADEKALAAQAERLMKYGVSFGVAAAVNVPFPIRDPDLARLENPVAVAMPYLVFAPAFWSNNMSRRQYCAAEWSAAIDEVQASAALALRQEKKALKSTQKNQRKQLKDVEKKIDKLEKKKLPPPPPEGDDPHAGERKRLETLREEKASLESALDETETQLSEVRGQARTYSCGWHKVGFFVGYPAMFNATTTVPERTLDDEKRRDVNPVVAFGVAGIPNAMVSLLAGWTVGIVDRDDQTDAILWSMVFGIGGNADLIHLFD